MTPADLSAGPGAGTATVAETSGVAELEAILALERTSFPIREQWSRASWRSELTSPSLQVLVARDGQLLGVIALRFGPDVCDLDRIVVDPQHRRLGVARVLLAAALGRAAARGVQQMILEVRKDNAAAIGLYQAYGFTEIAVRNDYYGPDQHAMIMSRAVGEL